MLRNVSSAKPTRAVRLDDDTCDHSSAPLPLGHSVLRCVERLRLVGGGSDTFTGA